MARIHSTSAWIKRGKEGNTTYYVETKGRGKGKVTFLDTGYTSNAAEATRVLGMTFEITLKSTDETYSGGYTTTVFCTTLYRTTGDLFLYDVKEIIESEFTRAGIVPNGISDETLTIRIISKLLHFDGKPPMVKCKLDWQYPAGGGKFDYDDTTFTLGSSDTPIVSDTTVDINGKIDYTCNVTEYERIGYVGMGIIDVQVYAERNILGAIIGYEA